LKLIGHENSYRWVAANKGENKLLRSDWQINNYQYYQKLIEI